MTQDKPPNLSEPQCLQVYAGSNTKIELSKSCSNITQSLAERKWSGLVALLAAALYLGDREQIILPLSLGFLIRKMERVVAIFEMR